MHRITILNTVVITFLSSLTAFVVNAIRPDGLDVFAKKDYEIYVPCPEPIKEVQSADPDMLKNKEGLLVIDARPESSFAQSRLPGAVNLAFDYLYPVSDSALNNIAASKIRTVVVYGDGKRPDPGHELARELAGRGIRNVMYIEGGYDKAVTIMKKR